MQRIFLLTLLTVALTLIFYGLAWFVDADLSWSSLAWQTRFASEGNGFSAVHGLALLCGAFWMGLIRAVAKELEPALMDNTLRYAMISFAAGHLLLVLVQFYFIWLALAAPVFFACRVLLLGAGRLQWTASVTTLCLFVAVILDAFIFQQFVIVWQTLLAVAWCVLWFASMRPMLDKKYVSLHRKKVP